MDFTKQLANGDSIKSATVTIAVGSGTDPSASSCILGSPVITGNIVSQNVGGSLPAGLQAGVDYVLIFTAQTASGRKLVDYGYIQCAAIAAA